MRASFEWFQAEQFYIASNDLHMLGICIYVYLICLWTVECDVSIETIQVQDNDW